jgi:hypothetical protein
MLQGYRRIENGEIFDTEQQQEVRGCVLGAPQRTGPASVAAATASTKKKSQPQ